MFTPRCSIFSVLSGIVALFFCGDLFAQSPQQLFLESFQSPQIQFPAEGSEFTKISPGRYPPVLKFLFQKALSWNPDGAPGSYSAACAPRLWQERLLSPGVREPRLQSALLRRYLGECKGELETGRGLFSNLLGIMTLRFSPQDHPFLHRVLFNLPGNIKLKGYLALKGDRKKRPLVVLRLGIFSSVEDFLPERYLLMQLFEQSPFNVLVVENMTGPDFIADNDRFSFGGYDEGLQNILLAQILRNSDEPLNKLVDSLHFVGMSLGGHGVLFASLLNQQMAKPPIQSFLAICPVVNLKETLHALEDGGAIERSAVNFWVSQRLEGLRLKVPSLAKISRFDVLPAMIKAQETSYRGGLSYDSVRIRLPEGMKDAPDFWKMNDFWPLYRDVQAPVIVWSTEQDPIVPFAKNAENLHRPNIGVVPFSQGVHCTLPIAYRWDAITTLLQAQILSQAPGFQLASEKMRIEIDSGEGRWSEREGVIPFDVKWIRGQEKFVSLEMKGFNLSLPLASFDFEFRNPALSASEQRMLERWLHQNLSVQLLKENEKKFLQIVWTHAK